MWITFLIKLPNYALFLSWTHFHMLKIVLISYPHRYNIFPQYTLILFTFVFNENIMKDNNNGLPKPIFFKILKKRTLCICEKYTNY